MTPPLRCLSKAKTLLANIYNNSKNDYKYPISLKVADVRVFINGKKNITNKL